MRPVKQPAKNPAARHHILMVRLNADERRTVTRAAKAKKLPVSTYLREAVLAADAPRAA